MRLVWSERRGLHTSVKFTLVVDHEHNFPLEDVIVH